MHIDDRNSERHCLVTGGAGFVGSHLVDWLLKRGHRVTAVDNLSTGNLSNLDRARKDRRFRFVNLSVSDKELMAPLVANVDDVYHLASYVGVKLASQTSSETILNNLRGIDTILDLVTRYRPRFLLTSTSEIYGKALDYLPDPGSGLRENADRVYGATEVHRWSYAGIKAVEEFLTLAKHKEEGLHTVIVRLFNVIGPRQVGRHGPVVPRFVDQALRDEPITIQGDGRQRRCFTYVDDALKPIIALMEREDTPGHIFNVGGSEIVTIKELAETVIQVAQSNSQLSYVPYEAVYGDHFEDVGVRLPDTRKLEEWTGLKVEVDLRESLRRIIEAYPASVRSNTK